MNILYLTFYFEPDLSAGSFRNTALVRELSAQLGPNDRIHVVTTQPNRYQSFRPEAPSREEWGNVLIDRIAVPRHDSGLVDQVISFITYFWMAHRLTRHQPYDQVIASSSRLFTAVLGAWLARWRRVPLLLDIRDLFRENMLELFARRRLVGQCVRLVLMPLLWLAERFTFGYARHINLVSAGFRPHFNPYKQATYSCFTNGIDPEFLHFPSSTASPEKTVKTILYAGNIGDGQGLHTIIPPAARLLGEQYRFVVIGDGGGRQQLLDAIRMLGVTNVDVRPPVSRGALRSLYQEADYLFVHLNDLRAFERVLPSKLFEYGATDKPILAGVTGYAAQFVRTHLPNSLLCAPGDVTNLVSLLQTVPHRFEYRADFVAQFQRSVIVRTMVAQWLRVGEQPDAAEPAGEWTWGEPTPSALT